MSWNYRVIKSEVDGVISFSIHEVYYDELGNPTAWSESPIFPYGDDLEDLQEDLQLMTLALNQPALQVKVGSDGREYLTD